MAVIASNSLPRRILIRGVNWLGDAVMTTPALLRLREKLPNAHVTMLTPAKLRDLWLNHPAVDDTLSIESGEGVFAVAKKLRPGNFDTAIVFPNSPRSAMEVWLAGIRTRIGHARPWRNFFLTTSAPSRADAVKMRKRSLAEIQELVARPDADLRAGEKKVSRIPASAHQMNDFLHLAAAVGANPTPLPPQLAVSEEEIADVRRKFGLEHLTTPIFGLNPGAEYGPAKRWPADKFAQVARELRQRTKCTWLIFGGKADIETTRTIETAIGPGDSTIRNLAGQTSLRELMASLKSCRTLLTNDTGPMHLAAALGIPVVVPFGSTSPELTGPISSGAARHELIKSAAPCSPCFLRECPIDFRCMNGITVTQIVEAVCRTAAQ